jgi:hypothetical protein
VAYLADAVFPPAVTATAEMRHWAKMAVDNALRGNISKNNRSVYFDLLKIACVPASSNRFRCTFRGVVVDDAWDGSGTVHTGDSHGTGIWTYDLSGHIEVCGFNGCVDGRAFRWRGRVQPFG